MSRRRMMMNRVVNLFDKNNSGILYNTRMYPYGEAKSDSLSTGLFASYYIKIEPAKKYYLVREHIKNPEDEKINRWCFYDRYKNYVKETGSIIDINIIIVPEDCYYIRFSGLITDIDNVKFYKA